MSTSLLVASLMLCSLLGCGGPAPEGQNSSMSPPNGRCGSLDMSCLDTLRFLLDPEQAPAMAAELSKQCDAGNSEACAVLTPYLVEGAGVTPDPERAFTVADRACSSGVPSGCNNLGGLYFLGVGVEANVSHAVGAYERACKLGDRVACLNAGSHHEEGAGVPIDLERAESLYKSSCSSQVPLACARLAQLYDSSPERRLDDARTHYDQACTGGIRESCERLAWLCAEDAEVTCGPGVTEGYIAGAASLAPLPQDPRMTAPLRSAQEQAQ